MRVVTLLSDFGSRDHYVSEMKGTILTLCPSVTLVDISHDIAKFDVRRGAFMLASASRYFPPGTIHVAVVDPGVGGQRRGLAIQSRRATYIGPDNGLLLAAAARDEIEAVYSIENERFVRSPVSPTFHGRDVFAYVAGKIACGAELSEVGPKISDPVPGLIPGAEISGHRIVCEVLVVDSFGNIVTTACEKDLRVAGIELGDPIAMRANRRTHKLRAVKSYSDTPAGLGALLVGSHGFLEIAINKGNAANRFRVRSGDKLTFMSGPGYRS